jgi:hypothetical protein
MKLFEFWAKIHKKPRGNWRPKCEVHVKIYTEKLYWRPYVKPLHILGGVESGRPRK